ncbi:hypothetical protein U1Q18_026831 [Sarracenia purpurea var. burkii]
MSFTDWRYENSLVETDPNVDAPKLEDFLGCCYSNSSSDKPKLYCQTQHQQDRINVNLAPNNNNNPNGEIEEGDDATNPSLLIQPYHFNHNPEAIAAGTQLQTYDLNPNPSDGMYNIPFDGTAASVSGFKSWLRQTPYSSGHQKSQGETSDGSFRSLALSMSPDSPHCIAVAPPLPVEDGRKRLVPKSAARESVPRKSSDTFGQRTSQYRGVTRCGYDKEEKAARAYDLAALKYWGPTTHTNFPQSTYESELEEMKNMTRQEFVAMLRRKSSGFSRGASMYRGVTRAVRIGVVIILPDINWNYLNESGTQEEAAEAYDIAAIKFRGTSAVTNFDINRYDVKRICSSSTLIAGDLAKRSSKDSAPTPPAEDYTSSASSRPLLPISDGDPSDELMADMVWTTADSTDHDQQQNTNGNNNGVSVPVGSTSGDRQSTKGAAGLGGEFGFGGDYSQACFELQGDKYGGGDDESDDRGGGGGMNRMGSLSVVHQLPIFALWNE